MSRPGGYRPALSHWALYSLGIGLFFAFGSRAVDSGDWTSYLAMAGALLVYTLLLIVRIRAVYQGPQLWKVMSRSSSVFMLINVLTGISTLVFVF